MRVFSEISMRNSALILFLEVYMAPYTVELKRILMRIRRQMKGKIFMILYLHGLFSGFQSKETTPLRNKTIVITRAVETSKESAEIFIKLGADVITFPTLDIVPPDSWKQFDEFILNKNKIDFIIFTSAHAVKMFSKRLEEFNEYN